MKIEIAEPGRMTQTGSSLLKLIQNNNMPVLDLLVRESIQNSLDARKKDSKYVEINYVTGMFDHIRLSQELEGITEPLRKRFPKDSYSYIAARDSYTVGLTGELDYKKVRNNDYGNLLKLIYEICKPQEAEGAGGSWGLGKTVYFRIGIGLVIYYSRIRTENGFASRLAASYVENESSPDSMIPVYREQAKRGIAWWGESTGENATQPITDEGYIADFLEIFGLRPYIGEDTGTTIIIPYIDARTLLSNNQVEYLDGKDDPIVPYWCHDIESYLSMAAQRWYAPRLNNVHYNNGAFLRLKINDKGLALDDMEPVFKVIQALYNRANYVTEEDIFTGTDVAVKVDGISIRNVLKETKAGVVAYAKVPRSVLGMDAPQNKPEPYMYFNCEMRDEDFNKPTVCFTRNPAMIISYENIGPWTSNITATAKEEYIIAVFVLNSWNRVKNSPVDRSLEEYIRKCEMADHTSWSDWSEGTYNPRIVSKIQNGVNKQISKEFAPIEETPQNKVRSDLGKLFGDMLLPPDGFGKRPGATAVSTQKSGVSTQRGINFRVLSDQTEYLDGQIIIHLSLESSGKKKLSKAGFVIQIDSESKRMTINEWEQRMGLDIPFSVTECKANISMIDSEPVNETILLTETDSEQTILDMHLKKNYSRKGTGTGVTVLMDSPHAVKMLLFVTLKLYRTDIKPAFVFEKETANG